MKKTSVLLLTYLLITGCSNQSATKEPTVKNHMVYKLKDVTTFYSDRIDAEYVVLYKDSSDPQRRTSVENKIDDAIINMALDPILSEIKFKENLEVYVVKSDITCGIVPYNVEQKYRKYEYFVTCDRLELNTEKKPSKDFLENSGK